MIKNTKIKTSVLFITLIDFLMTIIFSILMLSIGFINGFINGKEYFKREAAKEGYAEYITDENGISVWKWKNTVSK